jgi:hypothetical protein
MRLIILSARLMERFLAKSLIETGSEKNSPKGTLDPFEKVTSIAKQL